MAEQVEADGDDQAKGEGDDEDLDQFNGAVVEGMFHGELMRIERFQVMDFAN